MIKLLSLVSLYICISMYISRTSLVDINPKLIITKLMMNPINIQKLRIIIYKILLNFDDDDEDEKFCIL
jgi:hypothetical protein